MRARHSSADLYAAMPPATPRTTLGSRGVAAARRSVGTFVRNLGGLGRWFVDWRRQPGDLVLHQTAAYLFGRDDGGLLGRGRQERPRAGLQLARSLGGHDDETVSALVRIVGNGAMSVIFRGLFGHDTSQWFVSNLARMGRIWSSIRVRRGRGARPLASRVPAD